MNDLGAQNSHWQKPSRQRLGACRGGLPLVLTLSAIHVTLSQPASAQPSAEIDNKARARSHFARGVELAGEGAYAEALVEFSRAYELSPHYSVLYNVGQAYVALGRPVQAVRTLQRYLAEGGANIATERRTEVESEIKKQLSRTATLEIRVDSAGARLTVDGEEVGSSPRSESVRVGIGTHTVAATLASGARVEQSVTVAGEETRIIELAFGRAVRQDRARDSGRLQIRCAANGVAVSLDEQSIGSTPIPGSLVLETGRHRVRFENAGSTINREITVSAANVAELDCGVPTVTVKSGYRSRATVGYVLGAVGIALGGAAAVHFAWNVNRYHDWQDAYRNDYPRNPTPDNRDAINERGASVLRANVVTIALALGAGLSLTTGTVLVLTDGASSPSHGALPQSPTLAWRGVFP